jgi:hypothetical protein
MWQREREELDRWQWTAYFLGQICHSQAPVSMRVNFESASNEIHETDLEYKSLMNKEFEYNKELWPI